MKLPKAHHDLYADTLERANRAAKLGHRQATERAISAFESGEYAPEYDDLDDSAAVELLNRTNQDSAASDELKALTERICRDHEAAGYMLHNAGDNLSAQVRDYLGNKTEATEAELEELNERFMRWAGWNASREPDKFPSDDGSGDVVWLIERTPEQLATWLAEALEDLRENA